MGSGGFGARGAVKAMEFCSPAPQSVARDTLNPSKEDLMIRRGGYASAPTANVLSGTQFESLAQQAEMEVRVKRLVAPGTAPGDTDVVVFTSGAITLSSVQPNRQGNAGAAANNSDTHTPIGLSECDMVFRGQVPAGNLTLKVPGGAIWDVTKYT